MSICRFAFKALEAGDSFIHVYLSPPKGFSLRPRSLAHGLALPRSPSKAFDLSSFSFYLTQVPEPLFVCCSLFVWLTFFEF